MEPGRHPELVEGRREERSSLIQNACNQLWRSHLFALRATSGKVYPGAVDVEPPRGTRLAGHFASGDVFAGRGVEISRLTDARAFLEEWRSAYAASSARSFFLSPAWIDAWLSAAPSGSRAYVIRSASRGVLGVVGAPLRTRPRWIGARRAHLHEWGCDGLDAVYVEDNDILSADGAAMSQRDDALGAIIDALDAEEVVLRNCVGAMAAAAERVAQARGWTARTLRVQPIFSVDLAKLRNAGGTYLGSRSPSFRSKIERAHRRYAERGAVTLCTALSEADRERVWRTLRALHEASWRSRGEAGAFANPDLVAFHERLIARAPQSTELIEVMVAGETIGCLYNFVHEGRVLNYQSGFRVESDNQLTPGLLTHALVIQASLEAGRTAYDLLAGAADYKRRLAEQTGVLSTIVLERRSGVRAGVRRALRGLRSGVVRS